MLGGSHFLQKKQKQEKRQTDAFSIWLGNVCKGDPLISALLVELDVPLATLAFPLFVFFFFWDAS